MNQQDATVFRVFSLDVYLWLNMFRASYRPSSGTYNCTRGLCFYIRCWMKNVKTEAACAVVCSWWWAVRRPKHVEPQINVE